MTKRATVAAGMLLVFACALAGAGCERTDQRRYPLRGVVQGAVEGGYEVAHEDIPGFMPAMIMTFALAEGESALAPGDQIEAQLVVTDERSWLEDVVVRARGLPVEKRERIVVAEPGTPVPDFTLVDQDGAPLRLADYRGKALVLTFIYTRCPLPDYCPLMMKNFQKLDAALVADPKLRALTRLLSISFDTEYDTPEVLRSFGRAFVEDRGEGRFAHWRLAGGTAAQVREVAEFFGVHYVADGGQFTHSLSTAVIAPDGKVAHVFRGNQWTAAEVLEVLKKLPAPAPSPAG